MPVPADEPGLSSTTCGKEGVNGEPWRSRTGYALSKDTQQVNGRAQHPSLPTTCSIRFPLASLHHIPPQLPQLQLLLLLAVLLAVLGKVQGVGSGWRQASPTNVNRSKVWPEQTAFD